MRYLVVFISLVLVCSAAFAGEVELKPYTTDVKNPVQTIKTKELSYDAAEKPEGAKAPEGDLEWGKLTLGKQSYTTCTVKKDGKYTSLYFDADGDNDLAEEKPVAVRMRGNIPLFDLADVPGEFTMGEETLSTKLCLSVTPLYGGYLFSCTAYAGEFKIGDGSFVIIWVPTNEPLIRPKEWEFGVPTVYYGKKKASAALKGITLKEGKVKASYSLTDEDGLVELEAPKGLSFVMLYQRNFYGAFIPIGGKLHLKEGMHNVAVASFRKEQEGKRYELRIMLSSHGGYEVKKETKIGAAEPLTLFPKVEIKGVAVSVTASLLDTQNRDVSIGRDGEPLDPPKLKITDPDGKEVATHEFVPG